ncbi:DinB family protein [Lacibacter sp. H375]|uniref:DinB family protein n=1 Tax=Lacibacter sp. H375 TaxID=3133424 RepID=UPI0030C1324E
MSRPTTNDYAPFYHNYVMNVQEDDVKKAFENQFAVLDSFLASIPDSKADHAYAEGKWTVKQLLQHMIDAERIFTHRALWFARQSAAPLSGFDENEYAAIADVSKRTIQSLADEFRAVRKSSEFLFNSFSWKELNTSGMANNNSITVNAMGFVTLGHFLHHKRILEERYL